MSREYTNLLLERLEEGFYDPDYIIMAFCKYMSEDNVYDMLRINDLLTEEEFISL